MDNVHCNLNRTKVFFVAMTFLSIKMIPFGVEFEVGFSKCWRTPNIIKWYFRSTLSTSYKLSGICFFFEIYKYFQMESISTQIFWFKIRNFMYYIPVEWLRIKAAISCDITIVSVEHAEASVKKWFRKYATWFWTRLIFCKTFQSWT